MPDDIVWGFAERLRLARERRKYSQQQLADKMGISKGSISSYEKGATTPTLPHLLQLVTILDIDPAYLLGIQGKTDFYKTLKLERLTASQQEVIEQVVKIMKAEYWKLNELCGIDPSLDP